MSDGSETVQEAIEVRGASFRAMIAEGAVDLATVAALSGIPVERVRRGAGSLVGAGFMIVDEERVIGVAGLSVVPTRHRMRLPTREWYTWCAFDAIGIPAAMQVDAAVFTTCGQCGAPVDLTIDAGRPPSETDVVGWLPVSRGTNPIRTFCPQANLFCDVAHLSEWRRAAGDPGGQEAPLEQLAAKGVENWGPLL